MEQKMYENFLVEGVAETEDVAGNEGYINYYDDSPTTVEILDYNWASFL